MLPCSIDMKGATSGSLDLGAAAFRRELEKIGVTDVFFDIIDSGHMSIGYRYPIAVKYLAERLT